ncbi:MAG TPA: hypothetical protein PKL30_26765 [Leptospiraceae bacterium]|nr:hypothetical protein [Leptospiraceae bacterium]
MNLKSLVEEYKKKYLIERQREQKAYTLNRTLEDVVNNASLGKLSNGKKDLHARRIPLNLLRQANKRLMKKVPDLKKCKNFEELFLEVEKSIVDIKGIGKLTIYDIALKIGLFNKIFPEFVYLHSGALAGAKKIFKDRKGIKKLKREEFPLEMQELSCGDIENFLCIYKDDLSNRYRSSTSKRNVMC